MAFGSLKGPLSGGRRALRAKQIVRMRVYPPQLWDRLKKQEQKVEAMRWYRKKLSAQELLEQARGDLYGARTAQECLEAKSDLKLAKRELAKPMPHLGKSSFTDPMVSHSHHQALADLKQLPLRPSVLQVDGTVSEQDATRLQTYRRVLNMRKRVRKLIRAGGGQAG